jgi:hypothetical protein
VDIKLIFFPQGMKDSEQTGRIRTSGKTDKDGIARGKKAVPAHGLFDRGNKVIWSHGLFGLLL